MEGNKNHSASETTTLGTRYPRDRLLQDIESCQLLPADFPFAFIGMRLVTHARTQPGPLLRLSGRAFATPLPSVLC